MSVEGIEVFAVVAAAAGRVIGRDGGLPWHLPSDLKHFKQATMGCPMVMGRRTFASIGRPLPGRTTVVVTRDAGFRAEGVEIARSLDEALSTAARIARRTAARGIAVVGGGEIYAQALPVCDRIEWTEVRLAPDPAGAVVFPPLAAAEWMETARVAGERGDRDEAEFDFVTLRRR